MKSLGEFDLICFKLIIIFILLRDYRFQVPDGSVRMIAMVLKKLLFRTVGACEADRLVGETGWIRLP